MGLPIAKIKDSAKTFPIKPLTVYVLGGKDHRRIHAVPDLRFERIRQDFDDLVNNPPYALLPIEYKFLERESNAIDPNSILKRLNDYDIITRDVEIEEHYNASTLPSDYAVGYICGKIQWKLSFGLSMGLNIFTHELLSDIKSTAEKIQNYSQFILQESTGPIDMNDINKIISLCTQSLDVLHHERSPHDLKHYMEDFRIWLDKTTIIRKGSEDLTDEVIDTTFEEGHIQQSDYDIVLKKLNPADNQRSRSKSKYRLHLRIGNRLLEIRSSEQSVMLYLFAIAFAYRGEVLPRDLLTVKTVNTEKITPDIRRGIFIIYCCYRALKGGDNMHRLLSRLHRKSLKDILDQDEITHEDIDIALSDDAFKDFYERFYKTLSIDMNGDFDVHKLTNLMSRINNIIVPQLLRDHPQEVWDIFKLNFDQNAQCYYLNIIRGNIFIE